MVIPYFSLTVKPPAQRILKIQKTFIIMYSIYLYFIFIFVLELEPPRPRGHTGTRATSSFVLYKVQAVGYDRMVCFTKVSNEQID